MESNQQLLPSVWEFLRRNPIASISSATLLTIVTWVLGDFYAWKSFGTGGTPPTWQGYWRMTKFRIQRLLATDSLTDPSSLSKTGPSYLKDLPMREGTRPRIMSRTMPQRQYPESIDPRARARLLSMARQLSLKHSDILDFGPSKTEGGSTDAIYGRPDLTTLNPLAEDDLLLCREIAHVHPSDNSLHVWLSDTDARKVIETGWGQRFPLKFVKSGWTMVYAPRTGTEVDVVEDVMRAGISWITGVKI